MNLLDGSDQQPDERAEILAKWKDKPIEDLLNAKVESDLYIKTLEKQKDELRTDYLSQREELLAKAKFEDLIDRFEKSPKIDSSAPPLAKEVESPKIEQDLSALIKKELQETKIRDRQEANFNLVQSKLKEQYGSNYAAVLQDTGLSASRITEIAMESPEAVFKLLGITEQPRRENFQAPPRSDQRADSFAPKGQTKRDYSFYQEMKKANPKLYLDPKIAVQMHNDVISMGESAFYGQS